MNMSPDEQKICIFNQTGFCKFKDECLNKHLDQVCEQSDCTDDVCKSLKRHPKPCKKFMNSKYCYYNESCAYKHELPKTENSQHEIIKVMCEFTVSQQKDIIMLKQELNSVKSIEN